MKISPVEEYGLRCLLQLVNHRGGSPMSIREISSLEGLSGAYVGKLLFILQKGGLVQGVRGAQGGYTLARSADEISLGQALKVLSEQDLDDLCGRYTGDQAICVHQTSCGIRHVWNELAGRFYRFLEDIKLSDLAQSHFQIPGEAAGGSKASVLN